MYVGDRLGIPLPALPIVRRCTDALLDDVTHCHIPDSYCIRVGGLLLHLEVVQQSPEVAHIRVQEHSSSEPGPRLLCL